LYASGEIEGVIAVAVEASSYRWDEYGPWYNYYMRNVWYAWGANTVEGGEGDAYIHFLIDTLKPLIDARYRTLDDREHTAIGGSSMGGLIALYGAIQYPNVFSKVMALSPAVWFAEAGGYWLQNNRLINSPYLLSSYSQEGFTYKDVDYFLYTGTNEWNGRLLRLRDSRGKYISYPRVWSEGVLTVYNKLKSRGVPLENLEFAIYSGGTHGTGSWRVWEDDAMRWLFARETLPDGEAQTPLVPGNGSLIAGYEIQFSKSTSFATVLESGEVWDGQLWYEPTSLDDGLHYWRVRSINDLGYRSPWSSARAIVIDTTGPATPKHLIPFNGVTLHGYPVFYWLGLADAAAYQFEYAILETYDPVNGFSDPVLRSGELTTASYQPAFQAAGTYYWHVRARDAAGNWGTWSVPFTVTISP
jgi:pimeloyl-ACP methyl ester carboxylesterase